MLVFFKVFTLKLKIFHIFFSIFDFFVFFSNFFHFLYFKVSFFFGKFSWKNYYLFLFFFVLIFLAVNEICFLIFKNVTNLRSFWLLDFLLTRFCLAKNEGCLFGLCESVDGLFDSSWGQIEFRATCVPFWNLKNFIINNCSFPL